MKEGDIVICTLGVGCIYAPLTPLTGAITAIRSESCMVLWEDMAYSLLMSNHEIRLASAEEMEPYLCRSLAR